MINTVYGEGGYDPEKPNNNVVEQFDDGVEEPTELKQIPSTAVSDLKEKLSDPSVNSIAEVKSALKDFLEKIE